MRTSRWLFTVGLAAILLMGATQPGFGSNSSTSISSTSGLENHLYLPFVAYSLPPSPIQVLPNFSTIYYYNELHVMGEIWNPTSQQIANATVSARLYDNNGILIDRNDTFTLPEIIVPNGVACFDLYFTNHSNWSEFKFDPVTFDASSDPVPNLSVVGSNLSYIDNSYIVAATLKNQGQTTVQFASGVVTLYNRLKKVVDCDFEFVNNELLAPGESSPFVLYFFGKDTYQVSSYKIITDGDVVTPP